MNMNFCEYGMLIAATVFPVWNACGFPLHLSAGLQDEAIDVEDLLTAWRECDSSRKIAEWEISSSSSGGSNGPSTDPIIHFKTDVVQFVVVKTFADGKRTVVGLNPDYRFELEGAPNSPLRLKRIFSKDEVSRLRETQPDALDHWEGNLASSSHHVGLAFDPHATWQDLVGSRGFRLLSSRPSSRDGMPMIEITFDYIPEGDKSTRQIRFVRHGHALLNEKDKYYLPVEASFDASLVYKSETENYTDNIAVEYDFDFGPVPQVRKRTTRRSIGSIVIERETTYKTISVGKSFDDEEFRLTAFGIREPKGLELPSKGWPWWIKLSLFGVVAVGIAALFKRSVNKGKK